MTDHVDLIILGSGSTAFAAALRAQELGKTSVMTKARTVGGTCVNRGCLPSKNLIEAAKLLEFLRTNVPHIFAAGDAIGRQARSQMATPVGSRNGGIASHNALSGEPLRRVDRRVIPRVIFTDPQVATVGIAEEVAVSVGHRCWCNTLPMLFVPRAGAIRNTRGLIKMVADADTHEVLGVSMVGHNAGEVIHEAAMALRFRARLQDFIDLLHVYPTMAEALKLVAISRFKDPRKLSCCAE
jgi:mercuric reductase